MADAVFWQILESIQDRIQSLTISTESGDTVPAYKDDAVIIRKLPFTVDDIKHDRSIATPGITICPIRAVTPPEGGTNARDDTDYVVIVQMIDRDPTFKTENLKTYLKWQQQIRKLLQSKPDTAIDGDEGCINIVQVTSQEVVDPKMKALEQYFVGNLEVHYYAREGRGATT